ncbi:unnamed protein product, partial [Discosporangium mesarthrocarpum]
CARPGCVRRPSFGHKRARYCIIHKERGMVNVSMQTP